MKFSSIGLILTLFGVVIGLAQPTPIHTSMVELLATPEEFHGKLVQVSGYLHNQFEDTALYLSKEDADYVNGRQAVWIVVGDKMETDPRKPGEYFDCKRVMVEGIFDKNIGGHLGLYSRGGIRDISRIVEEPRFFDGKKRLKD
jgi:hypothetical protein